MISVDYKEYVQSTYLKTAAASMCASRGLDILAIPRGPRGRSCKLPSWVPDWSDTSPQPCPLDGSSLGTSGAACRTFNATRGSPFIETPDNLQFKGTGLVLDGYPIARIVTLCVPLTNMEYDVDVLTYYQNVQRFVGQIQNVTDDYQNLSTILHDTFGYLVTVAKKMIEVTREVSSSLNAWEELALSHGDEAYPTGEDVRVVFKEVLAAGTYQSAGQDADDIWEKWHDRMRDMQAFVEGEMSQLPDDPQNIHQYLAWFRAIEKFPVIKPFFSTDQGWQTMSQKYWVIARAMYRRLARTDTGHLALCPEEASTDDVVVLLKGGKTTYVVRKVADGWHFVGDCYMHGLMNGEAWDESKCRPTTLV